MNRFFLPVINRTEKMSFLEPPTLVTLKYFVENTMDYVTVPNHDNFRFSKSMYILNPKIEDYGNYYFQETLSRFQDSRDVRNDKILNLLQKEGISISRESMEEAFPDSVWTRAHFARYLLDHKYVGSINEAFDRYLGDHARCYVPREKVTPFQAISLIHEGNGIAVFAHPILCRLDKNRLESFAEELKQAGLDGIEAYYSTYRPADEQTVIQIAKRHNLALSGGSDFHGSNKPQIQLGTGRGNLKISYQIWENLRHHRHSSR